MAQQTLRTSGLLPGTVIRDRYVLGDGAVPMTGVQALVRLVFDLRRADQRAGRRRGYEQIKMNAVARYRESQAELRESLASTTAVAS